MGNAVLSEVIKLDDIHRTARMELILKDNSGRVCYHYIFPILIIYSEDFEWRGRFYVMTIILVETKDSLQ